MKSCSTIDLIKTPNGYSLIQNQLPINKASSMIASTSLPPTPLSKSLPKQKPLPQPSKKFIPQQNFTIYPYIYSSKNEQSQHKNYLLLPIKSQWFQLNLVSQIQRKAMPEWFKQKKTTTGTNVVNSAKFEKNQDLYKKYRNHIIEMGQTKYVTATMARKGLAGDACSIIRIHNFLEKWGLINYVHKKPSAESKSIEENCANLATKSQQQAVPQNCPKRRDGFERDKALISKLYQKEDLQLLKKLTKHYRPPCDSCMAICGVFWYEYSEQLVKKQFVDTQQAIKQVKSTQPIDYSLRICYSCYYEKNYPVVLGDDDFQKKSVIEKLIETGEKKLNGAVNPKKKQQENAKVVDSVERHRFNLKQCGKELKMSQKQLLDTLMQVPIQSMAKLSRLEPQTEDQQQNPKPSSQPSSTNAQSSAQTHHPLPSHANQQQSVSQSLALFKSNLESLQQQQVKIYEQFLQSWLLKMYAKLEKLEKWDKTINWKLTENQAVMKYNIAEKVRKMVKIQENQPQ